MLAILFLALGVTMVLVLVLLAVVVIGIRQEEAAGQLGEQAPSLVAALVRRLVGLCVRKPGSPPIPDDQERSSLAASTASHSASDSRQLPVGRDARGGESHCRHTRWSK
jgi:L-lactate permease